MSKKSPLEFHVDGSNGSARAARMVLPHGTVNTPVFMPVSTQGAYKGLTCEQLEDLDVMITLGNTYHLGHRPGTDMIERFGGLHKFMGWKNNILTDSGGFQMVSLTKFCEIKEEGCEFESPHDGSRMLLSPEESIRIQNVLGSDIMMQLDDVVPALCPDKNRVEEAMLRSIRWLDRARKAHKRPSEQCLFGIVQGGLYSDLRLRSLVELRNRNLDGYAIGGLSGGEKKSQFWRMVALCTDEVVGLPTSKPRYCMGVGYAIDLVVCVALGVDCFDCVYPARTARFGTALVREGWQKNMPGTLRVRRSALMSDDRPLDIHCDCFTCRHYTRAQLVKSFPDTSCLSLLTLHNVAHHMKLMKDCRDAIMENRFPQFVNSFYKSMYPEEDYPEWIEEALSHVGISLEHNRIAIRSISTRSRKDEHEHEHDQDKKRARTS